SGYALTLQYRTGEERMRTIIDRIRQLYSVPILPVCADVSDSASVDALFARAEAEIGFVGTLINNAGIAQQKLFCDLTEEDWDAMFDVHVKGAFHCIQAVLPQMIDRKQGKIINISSMWGQVGASCEVHYSAAKAALIGMTKALAKEVGPSHIQVNCIAPGVIETDMLRDFTVEDKNALAEETPLCRIGTPADIAKVALFLASDDADFITGQILGVNGGFVI
ncbi:MAG: SDR family oxidoreductase, partial [Clostridia bacterium]|nr:SDR family oxidoreductase [Clostridia bacterium]